MPVSARMRRFASRQSSVSENDSGSSQSSESEVVGPTTPWDKEMDGDFIAESDSDEVNSIDDARLKEPGLKTTRPLGLQGPMNVQAPVLKHARKHTLKCGWCSEKQKKTVRHLAEAFSSTERVKPENERKCMHRHASGDAAITHVSQLPADLDSEDDSGSEDDRYGRTRAALKIGAARARVTRANGTVRERIPSDRPVRGRCVRRVHRADNAENEEMQMRTSSTTTTTQQQHLVVDSDDDDQHNTTTKKELTMSLASLLPEFPLHPPSPPPLSLPASPHLPPQAFSPKVQHPPPPQASPPQASPPPAPKVQQHPPTTTSQANEYMRDLLDAWSSKRARLDEAANKSETRLAPLYAEIADTERRIASNPSFKTELTTYRSALKARLAALEREDDIHRPSYEAFVAVHEGLLAMVRAATE